MGWSTGWRSRAELVSYLNTGWGETREILDTGSTRKAHYQLVLCKDTGEKFIAVYLVKDYGKREGWGYKDMSESMGPVVTDCPLKLLNQSTCTSGYAVQWRQECRDYHAAEKRRRRYIAQLKEGDTIIVGEHALTVRDQTQFWRRKGSTKYVIADNYRIRPNQIELRPTT